MKEREAVIGLKTGTTKLAGSCLSTIVKIDGLDYAVITLHASGRSKAIEDHETFYKHILALEKIHIEKLKNQEAQEAEQDEKKYERAEVDEKIKRNTSPQLRIDAYEETWQGL